MLNNGRKLYQDMLAKCEQWFMYLQDRIKDRRKCR